MSSSSNNQWPPRRPSKRNKLRNGTFVIPGTGERSNRQFTLRGAQSGGLAVNDDDEGYRSLRYTENVRERLAAGRHNVKIGGKKIWDFVKSPAGRGVLKCTLAYLLGSLATYVSPVSQFLGKPGGKHVVATITVYFHANRTWGSMVEAALIAVCAIAYAQLISVLSMGLSVLGTQVGLKVTSHIMVLFLCIGFGLGFVGWVKQRLNNPLVNVGCTLASIAIITVVTKEEAVHGGYLSSIKIIQTFKILVMGVSITVLVNLLVWRTSARAGLRSSMNTAARSLGDMLSMITREFLNGNEEEVLTGEYARVTKEYTTSYAKMTKNLREAKMEHYILGRETIYNMDRDVLRSLEVLSQGMGGLRSAADTQLTLLREAPKDGTAGQLSPGSSVYSPTLTRSMSQYLKHARDRFATLASIEESEEHEMTAQPNVSESPDGSSFLQPMFHAPSDIFDVFIALLGPSMKSLAFTLSEILREPCFGAPPKYDIIINGHFRQSLKDALNIYNENRTNALRELYKSIELGRSRSERIQADIEEVAAACGHFSFSLQNVAEDIDSYLTVLEDLKYARATSGHTWNWLKVWRRWLHMPEPTSDQEDSDREALLPADQLPEPPIKPVRKSGLPGGIPREMANKRDTFSWDADPNASTWLRSFSQWCLKMLRFLARDDLRFGIKVGLGALVWAMFAFLPATRPIYEHWRGEWGLLSFMIVVSMTLGAVNTTGFARSLGTLIAGVLCLLAWAISQGNGAVLAFCGWMVSFGSFYTMLVVGNAPLGRTMLLAWNVTVLYAYSLSQSVEDDDDDEGGTDPLMFEIVYHRLVSVNLGILWGIIVCRAVWPISGRKKFKEGLAVLYLQLGLIWRRGPLAILLRSDNTASYMKDVEEKSLQRYAFKLDALRASAKSEFELRGPFPDAAYSRIMQSTKKILDGFHAMRMVTCKRGNLTPGERALLHHTASERAQLCDRICHVFQVLASSMMLEYPLTDSIPSVEGNKDRLLGKIYQFRKDHQPPPTPAVNSGEEEIEFALRGDDVEDDDAEVGEGGLLSDEETNGHDSADAKDKKAKGKMRPPKLSLRPQHIVAEESDYALLYAYTLVTSQVARELHVVQKEIEGLFGVLNDTSLLLQ